MDRTKEISFRFRRLSNGRKVKHEKRLMEQGSFADFACAVSGLLKVSSLLLVLGGNLSHGSWISIWGQPITAAVWLGFWPRPLLCSSPKSLFTTASLSYPTMSG